MNMHVRLYFSISVGQLKRWRLLILGMIGELTTMKAVDSLEAQSVGGNVLKRIVFLKNCTRNYVHTHMTIALEYTPDINDCLSQKRPL